MRVSSDYCDSQFLTVSEILEIIKNRCFFSVKLQNRAFRLENHSKIRVVVTFLEFLNVF